MKKAIIIIFKILIFAVLIGKILNWFFKFNYITNEILNTAMFCLIGIAFIFYGYWWDKKIMKVLLIVCGLYLITMNFIPQSNLVSIIGIVCIILPTLIVRFKKEKNTSETLLEN